MVATEDEAEILSARRHELERRLREKGVLKEPESSPELVLEKTNFGQAVKLASEFLAAVIVGVVLGLGFDQVTGYTPWGLVVFLFLGFAAGVLNMLRSVGYVEPHSIERPRDNDLK